MRLPQNRAWFVRALVKDEEAHRLLVLTPAHVPWRKIERLLESLYPGWTFRKAVHGDTDFDWVLVAPKGMVDIGEVPCSL